MNHYLMYCLDCEQSLFSQSSLSSAGLERGNWPRGKPERAFPASSPASPRLSLASRDFLARVTILRDCWQSMYCLGMAVYSVVPVVDKIIFKLQILNASCLGKNFILVRQLSLILLGLVVMRGKMSVFLQLMCLQSSIGRHQHPRIWLSGTVQNGYHR